MGRSSRPGAIPPSIIVANELLATGSAARLGMIGVGSSNDIDREFGLDSLDKACAALRAGRTRRIDAGRIVRGGETRRYFLGQANVGLGAMVNAYVADLARKRSRLAAHQTLAGVLGDPQGIPIGTASCHARGLGRG